MYKLFFWDSIDISIRGVVVPDNDIGIEETLDHERGICYDVINFTYPDSRIGRYLAANFWFVRWKPKRITCARGRQPFAGLEFCWLYIVMTITMAAKNSFQYPSAGSSSKACSYMDGGGGARRTVRRFGGLLGRYIGGMGSPSRCQSCYLLFPSLWVVRWQITRIRSNRYCTFGINGKACMSKLQCTRMRRVHWA